MRNNEEGPVEPKGQTARAALLLNSAVLLPPVAASFASFRALLVLSFSAILKP
jgi:hypothetical protein